MKPLLALPGVRRLLGWSALLSVLTLLTVVAQWILVARFVQAVFLDRAPLPSQGGVLGLLALALAARAGLAALREGLAAQRAVRLKRRVRGDLTGHLLALGPVLTARERSGALVSELHAGVEKLEPFYARFLPQSVHAGVMAVGLALAALLLDPLTGLLLVLTGPLVLVFMWLIGTYTQGAAERQWATLGRLGSSFVDALRGLGVLHAFGRVRARQAALAGASEGYRRATLGVLKVAFLSGLVLELAATLSTALVAVTIGVRLFEGHLGFQTALLALLLTPEFFAPLRQLGADHHAGMEAKVAAERLFPILNLPLPPSGTLAPPPGPPALDLTDVHLTLNGREVLRGVSLHVPAGGRLALVGPSGAGKTSVLGALLGFAPVTGEVTVSGVPLARLEVARWRAQVALVSQFPFLLNASVLENLRLAKPEATEGEVRGALRRARAEFVYGLPRGLHTNVGEGGARLSGGERARLSLARALLKDAPLLLLDEPTAQLDRDTEGEVLAALEEAMRGRTVVMVTHRLRALRGFERVARLEAGRVTWVGTPAEVAEFNVPREKVA